MIDYFFWRKVLEISYTREDKNDSLGYFWNTSFNFDN